MEPIFELAIDLPRRGSRNLLRAVHGQLRAAILDGRLRPGLRMPATRAFAAALGISRNTAVAAYDLLISQGYLTGRAGSGTYVANALPRLARSTAPSRAPADRRLNPLWRETARKPAASVGEPPRFDLRLGVPDTAHFPFDVWRRLSARSLRRLTRSAGGYGEPEGRADLREAIAKHISFARAVACSAEDVVVTAGAQQAFDLLARILVTPARTVVAMEDPCYPPMRAAFTAAGADIVMTPCDAEGLLVERLPARTRVICVTPSHQFPLGVAMAARRRAALLDFARAHDAVIIEDDYDGEFRFGGQPLDALQTLDRADAVFYVGTFSKSLFPALRLGFVATPAWARRALVAAKQSGDWHSPLLAQDTLAAFIAEGHLARHIRRMRRIYGDRRATLLTALQRHCGDRLAPLPSVAGLHLAATLTTPIDADAVVAQAAQAGVGIESLNKYAGGATAWNGLAFGFGAINAERIDEAIATLARLMK